MSSRRLSSAISTGSCRHCPASLRQPLIAAASRKSALRRISLAAPSSALALLVSAASARADLTFTRVFTVNQLISDGGEYADAHTLALGGGIVTDVNVGLVLAAPAGDAVWAGDYYAAIGNATGYTVLLNRIGKTSNDENSPAFYGSGANGVNVVFDDSAAKGDIHSAPYNSADVTPPAVTGYWQPDARNVDPAVVTTATPRTAFLSSFNDASTDGEWRLLLADDSLGGTARLTSWSLALTFTPAGFAPLTLTGADTLASATAQTFAANLTSQGLVVGPSAPGEALSLTGQITGAGNFRGNIILLGSYSPGNSPAAVTFDGNTVFGPGHVLTMEIGGTSPGVGYDTITGTGSLGLGGTLNVIFINGFVPQSSDFFQFFQASSIGGSFAQVNLPAGFIALGNLADGAGFTLSSIPEPAAWAALAGLGTLPLALRRRRRRA